MTTIEGARQTVADLEARLAAGTPREIELATEARRLSYSALSDNDEDAKKALAKLDAEDTKLRQSQLHLRDAIDEAKRRVASAERDEELAKLRESAQEVMALVKPAAERGQRVGELARDLCADIRSTFDDARRLTQLGAPVVNQRSLTLSLTRTILAQLRDAGLDIDLIAPGLRHPPDELIGGYVAQAIGWAGRVLDATKAAA
jgi:hypothetical protein